MIKKTSFLLAALATVFCANAQQKDYADKIIATVGNKVVLQSEIGRQFLEAGKDRNMTLHESDKCGMLRDAIAIKLMVEQAARDSVMITKEEVESTLENKISDMIMYDFRGDKNALERSMGKNIYLIKEEYREVVKEQLVYRKMYQEVIKDINITPKEVESFFNQIPESELSNIPATVEVAELVLAPEVDPEVEKYTKEKVEDIRKQIVENGRSFETMAQIYSEDDNSKTGGEMSLNRKANNIDNRFIAATFKLQPGEISPVFRSSFGYHIVQMVERNGDDAKIRYMVVIPKYTSSDFEKAIQKLDSTRNLLVSSKLTFAEALNKVGNDDYSKQNGGMLRDPYTGSSILSLDAITASDLALEISNLEVGEYGKPQMYMDERGTRKVRLLYLKSKTAPHKMNLKDDYSAIQNAALNMKRTNYLKTWLSQKQKDYYIKIDPNYINSCEELNIYTSRN